MGFGEGEVYANLTPPLGKVERLFSIRPSAQEKHFQNRLEKYKSEKLC